MVDFSICHQNRKSLFSAAGWCNIRVTVIVNTCRSSLHSTSIIYFNQCNLDKMIGWSKCIKFLQRSPHVTRQQCPCLRKRSQESQSFDMKRGRRRSVDALTQFTGVVSTLGDVSPTGRSRGAHRGCGVGVIHVSPGRWVLRGQGEVRTPGDRR